MSLNIEIPQPPRARGGAVDPHETERWLQRVYDIFAKFPTARWVDLEMAGSKLSDMLQRTHAMLTGILGWKSTTDTAQDKHVSNANGKKWDDHSNFQGNPHGTTAAQIPVTPSGTIVATTVQGALQELAAGDLTQPFDVADLTTAAIGGTAGVAWKLGTVQSGTSVISTAQYVVVQINGVVIKLAVVI
jgi:hypothetical protein